MNCVEIRTRLNDYIDNDLPVPDRREVEQHIEACLSCRKELQGLQVLQSQVASLPREISPERDLWKDIEKRIDRRRARRWAVFLSHRQNGATRSERKGLSHTVRFRERRPWFITVGAVATTIVVAVGGFWIATQFTKPAWRVTRLDGSPMIEKTRLTDKGSLRVGEWLETDAASRASIAVGMIGQVDVEPNTRIRLLEATATDHRLVLSRGTIHAQISAPPRLFFVETPSALAVDLGCEYTLHVDSTGGSLLQVTSGWVSLEYGGRESIIPAGAVCATRSGFGPGTPFLEDASDRFRNALMKFDFENGGSAALTVVLSEARNMDSITLWHLLFRTNALERARVYNRLAALVPSPQGVTREGVLRGDPQMLKAWQEQLDLGMEPWWKSWQ